MDVVIVAKQPIFTRPQLVIDAGAELITVARDSRHILGAADVQDAIGRASRVRAGTGTAQVPEIEIGIHGWWILRQQLGSDGVRAGSHNEIPESSGFYGPYLP